MEKLSALYMLLAGNYLLYVEQLKLFAKKQKNFYRVAVYGSARFKPGNAAFGRAYAFGRWLAANGMDAITGGGPGIMEAVNRGHHGYAREQAARAACSLGLPVDFPGEEPNGFMDMAFKAIDFGIRLTMFRLLGNAFVIFDGGIGSLLEIADALQHVQMLRAKVMKTAVDRRHELPLIYPLNPSTMLGVIPPIILVGQMWRHIVPLLEDMACHGLVDRADRELLVVVDSWQEAADIILAHRLVWREKMSAAGHQPRN